MAHGTIEYRISTHRRGEWRVLRQGIVMAIRNDLYDAVAIATHFAEREIGSIGTDVRVVMDAGMAWQEDGETSRRTASATN